MERDHARKFRPGAYPKLGEDVSQVILDGLWAEEELRCRLPISSATPNGKRNPKLLRRKQRFQTLASGPSGPAPCEF